MPHALRRPTKYMRCLLYFLSYSHVKFNIKNRSHHCVCVTNHQSMRVRRVSRITLAPLTTKSPNWTGNQTIAHRWAAPSVHCPPTTVYFLFLINSTNIRSLCMKLFLFFKFRALPSLVFTNQKILDFRPLFIYFLKRFE